ncbi:MAG: hypothetical protein AB8C46_13270 [Burkholderiaceae bacterium]
MKPNFRSRIRRSIAFIILSLLAGAASAFDYDQAGRPHPATVEGWHLVEHQAGQAVELTRASEGGALSTVCSNGQCNVFVEPRSACLPHVKYPILVNSARKMGVLTGVCRLLDDKHEGPRLVVHLLDSKSMFAAMLSGDDLSLAFPTMGGDMDVIEIEMAGVVPLLKSAIAHRAPDFKSAPSPDKNRVQAEAEPQPPGAIDVALARSTTRYQL